jgi:hypothetical protein
VFWVNSTKLFVGELLRVKEAMELTPVGMAAPCLLRADQQVSLVGITSKEKSKDKDEAPQQVVLEVKSEGANSCPLAATLAVPEPVLLKGFELERNLIRKQLDKHLSLFSLHLGKSVRVLGSIPLVHVLNPVRLGGHFLDYFDTCTVAAGSHVTSRGYVSDLSQQLVEIVEGDSLVAMQENSETSGGRRICPLTSRFLVSPSLWEEWVAFAEKTEEIKGLDLGNTFKLAAVQKAQVSMKPSWVRTLATGTPCQVRQGARLFKISKTAYYVVSQGDERAPESCDLGAVVVVTGGDYLF